MLREREGLLDRVQVGWKDGADGNGGALACSVE